MNWESGVCHWLVNVRLNTEVLEQERHCLRPPLALIAPARAWGLALNASGSGGGAIKQVLANTDHKCCDETSVLQRS